MLPNIDPKQMEKMMRQMGIQSKKINAAKVFIETESGRYIISSPDIVEINMQGQKSYQISGSVSFEENISEEDIKLVIDHAKCSREDAISALSKTKGSVAEAIILLELL